MADLQVTLAPLAAERQAVMPLERLFTACSVDGASLCLLLILSSAVGCRSTAPESVASIDVALTDLELRVGQSTVATATLRGTDGNVLVGRSITWRSNDPTVATVSGSGVNVTLTAIALGTTIITATSEG